MKFIEKLMNWLYYSKGGLVLGWAWLILVMAALVVELMVKFAG